MGKKDLNKPIFQEWDMGINVNDLNPDFLGYRPPRINRDPTREDPRKDFDRGIHDGFGTIEKPKRFADELHERR